MAKKAEKPAESVEQPAPAAPVAPPAPAAKPESDLFKPDGRFHLGDRVGVNGEALKYIDAVYVDSDGSEYKAKISPLPLNKGVIAEVPTIIDPKRVYDDISRMPIEKRAEALKEFNVNIGRTHKALLIDGKTVDLMEYNGLLLYATERQVGEGGTARIVRSPAANLLVNFSKNEKREDWKTVVTVRPKEHVPGASVGERTIPHFRLA